MLSTSVGNIGYAEPAVNDPDFVIQKFVSGIGNSPTTMAFVGANDILVLQKDDGKVRLVRDGVLLSKPVLDANVTAVQEQGMLGITAVGSTVYLYFTESDRDGGEALGKRVYRYDWDGNELVNPVLVKDLDEIQTYHNGGAMVTGLDNSVYLVVGDAGHFGKLQNKLRGEPDDTSVILRIAPEGPYYAIGIRNSFGLAVDPFTGRLWDTENGVNDFDEINLVEPGFNSGWDRIMGPANETQLASLPPYEGYTYSDPEFSWQNVVAPTGLTFVKSDEMAEYKNSLFVGGCNNGTLYKFELNDSRDGFIFRDPSLSDKVANMNDPLDEIIFGTGFGCVTDLEIGPDGLLYITSFSHGAIYRMIPKNLVAGGDASLYSDMTLFLIIGIVAASAGIAVFLNRGRKKNNRSRVSQETT
ncbi:MAG: PQQ-dependent sugar dehydrogenase, partial [Nitrososphaera sp.]|nr:PQQ-dependent sugar dehydrogenase [Nitrososphaera sp.]